MDDHGALYEFLRSRKAPDNKASPDPGTAGTASTARAPAGFERLGEFTYRRVHREPDPLAPFGDGPLLSARAPARDLVFFDTETTGLSGGAGNLAFLLGAACLKGGFLIVEQYFLSDFPGEAEFLAFISPLFSRERTFVSYNGSAFDSHLLVTRFRLNRLDLALPRQYDLLHPARRLWKTSVGAALGGCGLKNIEKAVLGVDRGHDIDGAEVPECYFRYLRTGDPASIEPVLYHNHVDVRSLALLLARIETLLADPDAAIPAVEAAFPADGPALAALLAAVDPARAESFLETRFQAGDAGCGRALARLCKRRREYGRAAELWTSLFDATADHEAGVELAMHCEHRARDAARALDIVRRISAAPARLTGAQAAALEARRKRLETKLKSGNARPTSKS